MTEIELEMEKKYQEICMRQIQPYQNGLKHKTNHHTPRRR